MGYRILTFNWHEAYLCLLAATGHDFDVVQREKAGLWFWLYTTRPVPPNLHLTRPEDAHRRLARGAYDLVVCHNFRDLDEVARYDVPVVLVFHNYRQTEIALARDAGAVAPAEDDALVAAAARRAHAVFVSPGKRASWGLDGEVILPGIDLDAFCGYRGDVLRVLRVGNFLVERDRMLGGRIQQEALRGIPHTTFGLNPSIPGSGLAPSFEALVDAYRGHRLFLSTTREGYEDGYNLALLEAMATGQPVVALRHAGSPLVDGESGLLADDAPGLRRAVLRLLDDEALARTLGGRGRELVAARFPLGRFVERWQEAFARVARHRPRPPRRRRIAAGPARNILLLCASYPATTGRYLERALRKRHRVVTAGPAIGPEIVSLWRLENLRESPTPQDIPYDPGARLADILRALPPGFAPDLVLWVESGIASLPPDIAEAPVPTAGYFIDSHYHLERHLREARGFDLVFVAQKACVDAFRRAGCRARWLPLAADPEIHRPGRGPKTHEIAFVGSLVEPRRIELLDELKRHFRTLVARVFLEDMAEALSRGAIVWNRSARGDLNMRVFEALAAGGFLLTDRAPGSGLDDLFVDGEHLALYDDEELVARARYFLERPALRRRIARRGRREVLRRHTYDHRAEAIVAALAELEGTAPSPSLVSATRR